MFPRSDAMLMDAASVRLWQPLGPPRVPAPDAGGQPDTYDVVAAYNAAADHYDDAPLAFWDWFGRRTVARLGLGWGDRVLDVCCGAGASAVPAALAVGPAGSVVGVDLADRLLDLARAKARRLGLPNVQFRRRDAMEPGEPDGTFDAVVCVHGLFFLPDMRAAVRRLWRLVRPGGRLAVTTWGPRVLEPGNAAFREAVGAVRPDLLPESPAPWERVKDPAALAAVMASAGAVPVSVESETSVQPLASADDWWTIALGSGYRGVIERLNPAERDEVRDLTVAALRRAGARHVETNAVYAVATKPAGPIAAGPFSSFSSPP